MNALIKYLFAGVFSVVLIAMALNKGDARVASSHHGSISDNDTPQTSDSGPDTLPYPFHDQSGLDPLYFNNNDSPLKLKDPSNIKTTVTYNPDSNIYEVSQKVGSVDYRPPTYVTYDDYVAYDLKKAVHDYWRQRVHAESLNQARANKSIIPPIHINGFIPDRIFGGGTIDIHPQGSAELIFGVNINRTDNPALPVKQRRISTFDFNEKIQLNVVGKIGEKLKLTTNYNTESTFEWENQMKLDYTGFEDEIIKKIEAGNVSFGLNTSLITGSQTLFGIKTQMQFGRLTVTSIISQERGKKSTIDVTGGAQTTPFEVSADSYEANKHFFLSQYFYKNYDTALQNFPVINSGITVQRIEVWVTNRTGVVDNTRNIVAFSDLGEGQNDRENMGSGFISDNPGAYQYPYNDRNNLYAQDTSTYVNLRNPNIPLSTTFAPLISGYNFSQGVNYEQLNNARKLASTEYTFNPQLGYISLNQSLNYDEVLAVAFQYTLNGHTYKVGEFSDGGVASPNALILKLLKPKNDVPVVTDGTAQYKYKTWDLMMKNVYSIGAYQINPTNFIMNIWYNNASTGTDIPFFPEGPQQGKPLLQVMNLDKLNQQQQPTPDGAFDFINGVTVNASTGRIIFPVVHPFGDYLLNAAFAGDPTLYTKYAYPQLYDSTKTIAQTVFAGKDRYKLKGSYQSSSNSDISLNAVNIPAGSVTVTAGGAPLTENVDYTVDYTLGRVKIINQSILNSGVPIKISLESNSLFNIQSKTLWGTHFDYRFNKDFHIGATIMNLTERPITQKVQIGDEPMSNTIMGIDFNYTMDAPFLTRWVDRIPGIDTKAPSSITMAGEFAYLHPGHNKAIGKNGASYIDDFEGTQSAIDIRSPQGWSLASVPQGQPQRFPEASLDSTLSGNNRAKLCWYVIDPLFLRPDNNLKPGYITTAMQSDHRVREVLETEVFPNKQPPNGQPLNISMLDLAYYPSDRGPYNYDVNPNAQAHSSGLTANGSLANPAGRWAGIMRRVETNDWQASNIVFIQFWMMDPYNDDVQPSDRNTTGELCFDVGDISEDVLKDGRSSFENGNPINLPPDPQSSYIDSTAWGRVPTVQSIVNAFDNDPTNRQKQDVGLDGLGDDDETTFFASYLSQVAAAFGSNSQAYANATKDPSGDNYHYYRGTDYDNNQTPILDRYKMYNGVDGNSPATGQANDDGFSESYPTSATTLPNQEDINRNNTLDQNEAYYEYRVKLTPTDINPNATGTNFITDVVQRTVTTKDGRSRSVYWYQFRIPIDAFTTKVGNIDGFTSIQFIRIYFKNVDKAVICRLARLELVRADWRKYDYSLLSPGEYISNNQSNTDFELAAVNFEENGDRSPVNYVLPPGIDRQQNVQSATLVRLNEQALSVKVCDLDDGDSRACYKTQNNLDVRSYKKIRMFIHAEQGTGSAIPLNDGDLVAFIRLGSDYTDNYYEYDIPLTVTPPGVYSANDDNDRKKVWPEANNMELAFTLLQYAKEQRNIALASGLISLTQEFSVDDPDFPGRKVIVKGNPNLAMIKIIMLGVRNPKKTVQTANDDGLPKCAEVWFNELRLTDFDERGGYAATARINAKLADFGVVNFAGNMMTPGFGSIESKVSDRSRQNQLNYDVSTQFELGKFFGDKSGIRLPFFWGYGETFITPQYNPLDPDILLKPILNDANLPRNVRDSIRGATVDYTRRRSINFTNIHKDRGSGKTKQHLWDIENFSLSVAYTDVYRHNSTIEYSDLNNYRGSITYAYAPTLKAYKPFDKAAWAKSKWMTIVREMSFSPLPASLGFTNDMNRSFSEIKSRNITGFTDVFVPTNFNKTFLWTRDYNLRWDIMKNVKLDFTADNMGTVLEPYGEINTKDKKDSLWRSIKGFGLTTSYHHTTNVTYNVPLNKIPIFDWITPSVRYSSGFTWMRAPLSADSVGNVIGNNSKWDYTVQLNMTTLYNKVPYFKKVNNKRPGQKSGPASKVQPSNPKAPKLPANNKTSAQDSTKQKNQDQYAVFEYITRAVLSLRSVSVNYSVNSTLSLPGYSRNTQFLGFDDKWQGPGLGFLFGQEDHFGPNHNEVYPAYAKQHDLLVHTASLFTPFTQGTSQNLTARATIEPFPDVKIDVTGNRTYTINHSEFYKWDPVIGDYTIQSPTDNGSFSISIISWKTAFTKDRKKDHFSKTFQQFLDNRAVISKRLGENNPNSAGLLTTGYADGYSNVSQEVLIPAFLSAYTKKNAGKANISNLFQQIPLPNWRLTYDGLTKFDAIKKHFKTVTLSHSYRSTYSLSGFSTNLDYDQLDPMLRNSNQDFYSKYTINTVTISEQFAPLIGIDMTWNNSLTTRIEFKKDRTLSLSLSNTQLTEIIGNEYVFGFGYRIPKVTIGFLKKIMKDKSSDLNLRADMSIRNNQTVIRKSVENINVLTAGQSIYSLKLSADYALNTTLTIRLFWDWTMTNPLISSSFKTANTNGGVSLRFTLQ